MRILMATAMAVFLVTTSHAGEGVDYDGKWKWTSGRWAKNPVKEVTGTIVKSSDSLYKGTFYWQKNVYTIDMKATKVDGKETLTGTSKVGKRTFSMDGTRAADGSIDATYSNGKDTGWLKLKPAG